MAEATGTNLAVSDGADSDNEQKSGFMDTIGSTDMVRQMTLVIVLVISVAIAIFVVLFIQEPDFRPLAKMDTEELIETLDYLDANQIEYQLEGNIVHVRVDQYQKIKLGMSREWQ